MPKGTYIHVSDKSALASGFYFVSHNDRQDYSCTLLRCFSAQRVYSFSNLVETTALALDLRTSGNGSGSVLDD